MPAMYIAVDIGGTKTLVALFDESGNRIKTERYPTNHDYPTFVNELTSNIKSVAGQEAIEIISIAVPGHVEDDSGVVKGFGNLDWKNIDIISDLSGNFDAKIIVDNDANLGGLGEATFGAGRGKRKVLYITVSTGIGTGVVVDGKLDPATKESEGGQVLLSQDGKMLTWQKLSSGKAFFEKYGQPGSEIDDPEIWKEFAETLALGIWELSTMIQPDVIVIGGSMGMHFKKYGDFLIEAFSNYNSPVVDHPSIVQAESPDEAVIIGCYQAAIQYAKTV
jgi:glucokinase